jgi:hypothetical protein
MFYVFAVLSLVSRFIAQLAYSIGDKRVPTANVTDVVVSFGFAD